MQGRVAGDKAGQPVSHSQNIRIVLAFDGTSYAGWQVQPDRPTIQGIVREAIERTSGELVKLTGSGRTDAGTHARGLVANFLTSSRMPSSAWVPALNRLLPEDIRVLSARSVPQCFHARLSARSKVYRYQVYRGPVLPPHRARDHYHYPYSLDLSTLRRAARMFEGEHDFASFAAHSGERNDRRAQVGGAGSPTASRRKSAKGDASPDTVRRILSCRAEIRGSNLIFQVEGNGFLHHMVRNMVGTLLEVGRGRISLGQFEELLRTRDRTQAGFTAPAHGLTLVRVRY